MERKERQLRVIRKIIDLYGISFESEEQRTAFIQDFMLIKLEELSAPLVVNLLPDRKQRQVCIELGIQKSTVQRHGSKRGLCAPSKKADS